MRWAFGDRRKPGRQGIGGLIALNAVLLTALGAVTFAPTRRRAVARSGYVHDGGGGRQGATSNIVYIVDTTNHELIAIMFEPSQRELVGIGYRDLAADALGITRGAQSR